MTMSDIHLFLIFCKEIVQKQCKTWQMNQRHNLVSRWLQTTLLMITDHVTWKLWCHFMLMLTKFMKALMMSSAVILSKEERQMTTNLYIRMILDLMQVITENVIFFVKTNQKCGKLSCFCQRIKEQALTFIKSAFLSAGVLFYIY